MSNLVFDSLIRQLFILAGAPAKAKIIKFLDSLLRQFALLVLVCFALIDHPLSQRSLTLWNVTVAMLGLVPDQVAEALVPRWLVAGI